MLNGSKRSKPTSIPNADIFPHKTVEKENFPVEKYPFDIPVEKAPSKRQIFVDGKTLGKSEISGVFNILFLYDYFFLNKFFFSF